MLGNNTLITGDNKGVAAYLLEQSLKTSDMVAEGFVAGFSQANVGDTSPNINGAYCEEGPDEGKECRLEDSTCGGRNEPCHGRGPFWGLDDAGTKSCFEIGRRQFQGAKDLYDTMLSSDTPVTGDVVRSFHTFFDFSNYTFPHPNGTVVRTCPAAMGYSFAAGTSDGPGAFDFKQNNSGDPNASPVWGVVGGLVHSANETQKDCQAPKPILLDVGETSTPYDWSPNIVDIQLFRFGQIFVVVSPGEATTMAGRRWRESVASAASASGLLDKETDPVVVLGGPANTYTHYITTEQEYNIQRYEGASTLYGPHTLNAYINLTLTYLPHLDSSAAARDPMLSAGPQPQINTNNSLNFISPVVFDSAGFGHKFGDVVQDVDGAGTSRVYKKGDVAQAVFRGANPRNDLRLEKTYAGVEKLDTPTSATKDGLRERQESWTLVKSDEDWELVFEWKRKSGILGTSEVTISWELGDVEAGHYRLRYWGDAKNIGGEISNFQAASGRFVVG